MSDAAPQVEPGQQLVEGQLYMRDAKGVLTPVEVVKAQTKLEDQLVRKIIAEAVPLAEQVATFRQGVFDQVDTFAELLHQQYQAKIGGVKGNITLQTFDGLLKIQVQVADLVQVGAELQVARDLVDECLTEWSTGARPELRALVQRAFSTDKEGEVSLGALLSLLRLDITDPRWLRGMQAIRDALRPVGTKRYVRFYRRPNAQARWTGIVFDGKGDDGG